MLKYISFWRSNRRAYWIPVLSLVRQTGMTSQGRVTMTEQAELRDHPCPCSLVMPWLDHGIHAGTTRHGNAYPFGKAKEWIAGSSPAMTNGLRTNGLCQSAFPMPLPKPRHAMARPWHPCRYTTTRQHLSIWKGQGVDCRIKSGNDGERGDKEWGYLNAVVTADAPQKVTPLRTALPSSPSLRHRVLLLRRSPLPRPRQGAG